MPRRITVPDDHVALILSAQLADEFNSLAMAARNKHLIAYRRYRSTNEELAREAKLHADIWGDILLVILEAKEV